MNVRQRADSSDAIYRKCGGPLRYSRPQRRPPLVCIARFVYPRLHFVRQVILFSIYLENCRPEHLPSATNETRSHPFGFSRNQRPLKFTKRAIPHGRADSPNDRFVLLRRQSVPTASHVIAEIKKIGSLSRAHASPLIPLPPSSGLEEDAQRRNV